MNSRYPFLAKNRKEQRDQNNNDWHQLFKQLAVVGGPLVGQYQTGLGENGKLEPEKPTHLLQTNMGKRTVHEGERLSVSPDGQFSVQPASSLGGQEALAQKEQREKISGYQYGKSPTHNPNPPFVFLDKTDTNQPGGKISGGQYGKSPTHNPNPPFVILDNEPGGQIGKPSEPGGQPETIPQTDTSQPGGQPEPPPQTDTSQLVSQPATPSKRTPLTASEKQIQDIRSQYAGRTRAATGAVGQQTAQLGLGPQATLTEQAMTRRGIGAQEEQAIAPLRAQMVTLDEKRRQFDENMKLWREKFQHTKEWDDFLRAAEYGDDATVAAEYEKIFGRPITDAAMINNIRDWARREGEAGAEAAEITTQTLKTRLGVEKFNAITNMINNDAPPEMVLKHLQDAGLSEDDAWGAYYSLGAMRQIEREMATIKRDLGIEQVESAKFRNIMDKIANNATFDMVKDDIIEMTGNPATALNTFQRMANKYMMAEELLKLEVQSARLGVTKEQFNTTYDMIKNGALFEDVWPELRSAGLTYQDAQRQYDNMKRLAYGKEDMLNVATALMDTGNWRQAANIISEATGIDVNFENMADEEKRKRFAEGLEMMSKYASQGMDFDDALVIMEKGGLRDLVPSLNADQIKTMYENMVLAADPLYQSTFAINDDTLRQIYGQDVDLGEIRKTIANVATGIRMNPDGTFSIDYDYLGSMAGGTQVTTTVGTGEGKTVDTTTPAGRAEAWDNFTENLPEEYFGSGVLNQTFIESLVSAGIVKQDEKGNYNQNDFENWYKGGGKSLMSAYQTGTLIDDSGAVKINDSDLASINTLINNNQIPDTISSKIMVGEPIPGEENHAETYNYARDNKGKIIQYRGKFVSFSPGKDRSRIYDTPKNFVVMGAQEHRYSPADTHVWLKVKNMETGEIGYLINGAEEPPPDDQGLGTETPPPGEGTQSGAPVHYPNAPIITFAGPPPDDQTNFTETPPT